MDDEENKPGITQIPLIHDLVFDPTQPLKPPARPSKSSPSKKPRQLPPGYDPDTADLFEELIEQTSEEDVEYNADEAFDLPGSADAKNRGEDLRAELSDELGSILDHLNEDQSETNN